MKQKFPSLIPIFPLNGVIYFPQTNLPLNIFEGRYLDLVNDTMKKDKLMGMVQEKNNSSDVYTVGCLGKISDFKKSADNRILINLSGITRFEIKSEVKNDKQYREFHVAYDKFNEDTEVNRIKTIQNEKLKAFFFKTKNFFERNGLLLNWHEFDKLDETQKINTLAMIAPVSNQEKQKLLETITLENQTQLLLNIMEFYLHETDYTKKTIQ
jgi:Lon protease-like protein